MEWSEYRERIRSVGYRYNVPALFADREGFEAFCEELLAPYDPADVEQVGGIDAIGFVPGAVMAWEENETPLELDEEYGVHTIRPWHELGTPEREQ